MAESENLRYLQERIQPILAPIIEQALREKPADKIAFFIQQLRAVQAAPRQP